VITDGETGLLVPPGDAPALAKAIWHVLDDKAQAATLGARARSHCMSTHGIDVVSEQVACLYTEVGFPPEQDGQSQ